NHGERHCTQAGSAGGSHSEPPTQCQRNRQRQRSTSNVLGGSTGAQPISPASSDADDGESANARGDREQSRAAAHDEGPADNAPGPRGRAEPAADGGDEAQQRSDALKSRNLARRLCAYPPHVPQ
ncbi:hypothetical protein GGF37_006384, partial [Kickxella alabastrina]